MYEICYKVSYENIPTYMTLMGSEISFVDQCKYLGTIIDVQTSDSDMKLQMKRLCSCDMAPCGNFRADGETRWGHTAGRWAIGEHVGGPLAAGETRRKF